ncbi:MAG: phosphoribosylanthranilate isomerase [Prevotella sp.]|nr:phosphoribosylanthranilate isomerase [Prevotella sp.]
MIIKVCGMRDADNIRAVEALGVDMLGFIFYPDSPRYVPMISSKAGIIPDYSNLSSPSSLYHQGDKRMEKRPAKVGVFVDDMPQNIVTRVYNYDLDYVQLHGEESPVMIENLRRTLDPDIHPGIKIMKALSISSEEDLQKAQMYEGLVDMLLFDTKCMTKGGSGKQFDWSILDAYEGPMPFLLSGGIGPEDVERIKAFRHPYFAGIDLNSRFETEPGRKDIGLLDTFVRQLTDEQHEQN